MEIESAMKEEIVVWKGIIKAIHDGHSCLSLEVQRLILHLVKSGKVLADKYGFEELLDSYIWEHDAVVLFDVLHEQSNPEEVSDDPE